MPFLWQLFKPHPVNPTLKNRRQTSYLWSSLLKTPKILIWDLETAGINGFEADLASIVCFGYKWLGEKNAHVLTVDQYPNWFSTERGLNDKPLIQVALKIMDEADIIVAHYGDKFDKPFFAGRCAIHGLTPPAPAKQRDTCFIAWKTFKFSSNRLQNLADIFRLGEKKYKKECPDEWPGWWLGALAGNKKAIKEMAKYCAQDIQTLEQVYLRLRPYDKAHPRIVDDRATCGTCGGEVEYRGFTYTTDCKYRRFQCKSCGKWGKESRRVK